VNGGRLTASATEALPSSDIASSGTIYYLPYLHDQVAIYNGASWDVMSVGAGLSLALATVVDTNYDVFMYDSGGGTPALELSAAWASDTARTDALVRQDGVWVKQSDTTRRYVGTLRSPGANVTTDDYRRRFVWSMDNRVKRSSHMSYLGAGWIPPTGWTRGGGSDAEWSYELVVGLDEDPVEVSALLTYQMPSDSAYLGSGFSLDGAAPATNSLNTYLTKVVGGTPVVMTANPQYNGRVGLGYHEVYVAEDLQAGGGAIGISAGALPWIQTMGAASFR
jgi:hypothetical protein